MNFDFGSDLHLVFNVSEVAKLVPQSDTLVLGGDIFEIQLLLNGSDRVDYQAREWFKQISAQYKTVIWIFGNHEHYQYNIDESFEDARNWLKRNEIQNIHILENQTLEIEDAIFFGATLWTDVNKQNPMDMQLVQNGLNDYRAILKYGKGSSMARRLGIYDTIEIHFETVKRITEFVDLKTDKKKVLLTHHLPLLQCVDPLFHNDRLNGGYASDLFNELADSDIQLVLHGHSHRQYEMKVENIRVLANPRGYHGHEPMSNNFTFKLIEI